MIENQEPKKIRREFLSLFGQMSPRRIEIYARDGYRCVYCGNDVIDTSKFFDLVGQKHDEVYKKYLSEVITDDEYEVLGDTRRLRKEVEESEAYRLRMATLDHRIPISKGGENGHENIVTCCIDCNRKKSTKVQLEDGYTRLANTLLEKMSRLKMSGTCWQVLLAIIRKLYGYNKIEDWIEYSQLCEICNLPKSRVCESVKELRKLGIVTQTRNGIRQMIRINKDFETVTEKRKGYVKSTNRYVKPERSVTESRTTKDNKRNTTKDTGKKETFLRGSQWNSLIDGFEGVNPMFTDFYKNATERRALDEMARRVGYDKLLATVEALPQVTSMPYAPKITKPSELKRDFGKLIAFYNQERGKGAIKKSQVIL